MSSQIKYPREVLQRVSDRKKRKLAIDDSDKILLDSEVNTSITPDSQIEVIEDSQSSLKGYRDLFGELIPYNICTDNSKPKNKLVKKTPLSKKKEINEEKTECSIIRSKRIFIPTPRIIKVMKDAQSELYSLMGLNNSSSDISITSSDNLNVSGVNNLLDIPTPTKQNIQNDSSISLSNNEIIESHSLFKGIIAFVDYKIDNDRSGVDIIERLIEMGAKVEKTFNQKVTHVVFRDGYRKTYNKAIERKVPLVSARWIENSRLANKIMNPVDYPPIGIEKYINAQKLNYNFLKYNKFKNYLRQSNFERDQALKSKCDTLMNRINNFTLESSDKNNENSINIETPKKQQAINDPNNPSKPIDVISILSDQLCKVLNTDNSPLADEKIDELYLPMSVKILRKMLTPKGIENKTPTELDSDLVKIEDRLNLNSQARQRLRKLLFPSNMELLNMSIDKDFPSPSPQKLRISAPARLTSTKKQKLFSNSKVTNNNKKTPQKENVIKKIPQWRIPTDLRPIKIKKINNLNKKTMEITSTQNSKCSIFSRNSSMIFQTPKDSIASSMILQTIACTGMSKCEINTLKIYIQNLGVFTYQPKVEPSTMYLITKSQPNRTLNMVYAMAFGCYIVSEKWVHESYKAGRWLIHQEYLISDLSKPVKEFQTRRHTFGSMLTFHIFDEAGKIYISDSCEPPAKDLKRLVRTCGGQCTNTENLANVVVGYTTFMMNNINEKWILDCITKGTLLNIDQYKLVNKYIT